LADFVAEVRVNASGKKWIIVTDLGGEPAFVLDSHHFLRDALLKHPDKIPGACLHRPVVVRDMQTSYRPRHRRAYVVFVDGFPGAPSSPHPSPPWCAGLLTLQSWSTKPSCKGGNAGLSLVLAVRGGNPRFPAI
jgi:hypothetical protein